MPAWTTKGSFRCNRPDDHRMVHLESSSPRDNGRFELYAARRNDTVAPWCNRDGGEPIGMVRDNAEDDRQRLRGRRSREAERERPALVLAIVAGRES